MSALASTRYAVPSQCLKFVIVTVHLPLHVSGSHQGGLKLSPKSLWIGASMEYYLGTHQAPNSFLARGKMCWEQVGTDALLLAPEREITPLHT